MEPDPRLLGPCDDPLLSEEINTDAAAAKALKEFKARADQSGEPLELREYGAWLYRDTDGSILFGNVVRGDPYAASVSPWTTEALEGVPFDQVVGFIHNHPGGGATPSVGDWHVYHEAYQRIVAAGGTDAQNFRLYVAGTVNGATRLFVNKGAAYGTSNPGLEVHPDTRPCGG